MAKPFITIIGLGATGSAVGLALRKAPGEFEVVGHDKSQAAETEARRHWAVERIRSGQIAGMFDPAPQPRGDGP